MDLQIEILEAKMHICTLTDNTDIYTTFENVYVRFVLVHTAHYTGFIQVFQNKIP